ESGEEERPHNPRLGQDPQDHAVRIERLLGTAPLPDVVLGEVVHSHSAQRMVAELTHGNAPEVVPIASEAEAEIRVPGLGGLTPLSIPPRIADPVLTAFGRLPHGGRA